MNQWELDISLFIPHQQGKNDQDDIEADTIKILEYRK